MITADQKKEIIEKYARTAGDTGSPEVQVALLTARINDLNEHFKVHPRITTQEEVFLRWLVREELYLHILRIQILNLTEILLSV